MKVTSRSFKSAIRAMVREEGESEEVAELVEGIHALAPLQPAITLFEAQALCAVVWRFDPWSVDPGSHCSKVLAQLVRADLHEAEELIGNRQIPATDKIRALHSLAARLRKMNRRQGLALYIAADLLKRAPAGASLGDFFVLLKS